MVMLLRLGELLLVLVMANNCSPVGLSGWCPTVLRDCEQSLDLVGPMVVLLFFFCYWHLLMVSIANQLLAFGVFVLITDVHIYGRVKKL